MISVVVPVYNGAASLGPCLEALRPGLREGDELIVVNDRSTDESAEIARRLGARVFDNEGPRGPAAARNTGVRHATGAIVAFVDADVVVHPDTLAKIRGRFEAEPDLDALFGSYDAEPAEPNFLSQYRNLLHHYVHQRSNPDAKTFWAGCGAIRRAAYLEVGGFDQETYRDASIEDIELGLRLSDGGHRIALDRDVQATHLKRWTLRGMLNADIQKRAYPWSKLIIARRSMPNDLNLRLADRLSGALVLLAVAALPIALLWWLLGGDRGVALGLVSGAAIAIAIVMGLNRDLYRFFLATRGAAFMLGGIALHLLYYCYASATFAYCRLSYRPPLRSAALVVLALSWCLAPSHASAHATGRSYSDLAVFEAEVSYFLNVETTLVPGIDEADANRDGTLDAKEVERSQGLIFERIAAKIAVLADGVPCQAELRRIAPDSSAGRLALQSSYRCPHPPVALTIRLELLERAPGWHRHLLKISRPDETVEQHILSASEREIVIRELPAGASTTTLEFVSLGVEHILIGYDHIFFLLGLVVATRKLKKLLGLVTAFTLGHTVTLISATLISSPAVAGTAVEVAIAVAAGAVSFEYLPRVSRHPWLHLVVGPAVCALVFATFWSVGHLPDPIFSVEVLIAVSVIFVAVENFFLDDKRRRWILALSFGLVHGFGFASVLSELHLPSTNQVLSLLAFNLGVEVGQLIIVSIAFPLVLWIGAQEVRQRRMVRAASGVIALGGMVFLSLHLFG
ncbi:MAG: HupE/UreJ family protein [Deltaproteobacteria bacterium]|nr:HupE/UreJ family protein [Deltaproteobacteria bacterium]